MIYDQELKKLKEENKRLKDELSNLPILHKTDCDKQKCSICCAYCTCGAEKEREMLLREVE